MRSTNCSTTATVNKYMERGTLEVAPLAYMRGRTLSDAFVILDEAQNATDDQLKMFLTRSGTGSKMVVTGDVTQIDLPRRQRSGLRDAATRLAGIDDVGVVELDESRRRAPSAGRARSFARTQRAAAARDLLSQRRARAAASTARRSSPPRSGCWRRSAKRDAALSLSSVGDGAMRALNREHRGKDRATDVLSFPTGATRRPPDAGATARRRRDLGRHRARVRPPITTRRCSARSTAC